MPEYSEAELKSIREYCNTPMTAQEREEFDAKMKNRKASQMDMSIWNPHNPNGRCYDPNYRMPLPEAAKGPWRLPKLPSTLTSAPYNSKRQRIVTTGVSAVAPVARSPSPSPSVKKLNPLAPTFDGSWSPTSQVPGKTSALITPAQPTQIPSSTPSITSANSIKSKAAAHYTMTSNENIQDTWEVWMAKRTSKKTAKVTPVAPAMSSSSYVVEPVKSVASINDGWSTPLAPKPVVSSNDGWSTPAVAAKSVAAENNGWSAPATSNPVVPINDGWSAPATIQSAVPINDGWSAPVAPKSVASYNDGWSAPAAIKPIAPANDEWSSSAPEIKIENTAPITSIRAAQASYVPPHLRTVKQEPIVKIEVAVPVATTTAATPPACLPPHLSHLYVAPQAPLVKTENTTPVQTKSISSQDGYLPPHLAHLRAPAPKPSESVESATAIISKPAPVIENSYVPPHMRKGTAIISSPVPVQKSAEAPAPVVPPTPVTLQSPVAAQTSPVDAWTAMLNAGDAPTKMFKRDAYRKPLQQISSNQDPSHPTSPTHSRKSSGSDKVNHHVMPTPRPYRPPKDNPRWKITEDTSAFAAHIVNKPATGQRYYKIDDKAIVKAASTELAGLPDTPSELQLASSTPEIAIDTIAAEIIPPTPTATIDTVTTKFVQSSLQVSKVQNPQEWPQHPSLVELMKNPTKYEKYLGSQLGGSISEAGDLDSRRLKHDQASVVEFFDDEKVSNDGVEDLRGTTGEETQLMDWDGKMMAPPLEGENRSFNSSFIPAYIEEWTKQSPAGPSVTVPFDTPEFARGENPISNAVFLPPVTQPDVIPDVEHSENEKRRKEQTSQLSSMTINKKITSRRANDDSWKQAQQARYLEIEVQKFHRLPDPFAPKLEMYIRPAEQKDAARIQDIYNHYVLNTIIPEDQTPISLEVAEQLIGYCQQNKLPILVAVQGKLPPPSTPQPTKFGGRRNIPQPKIIALPSQEYVIGFANTERSGFGFSGSTSGLHRYTLELKVYVDPTYTRKGVGRNLFDQLIHILYNGYGFRDTCRFLNSNNDPVYKSATYENCHMMYIRIPAEKRNDTTLPWLTSWLKSQFKFHPSTVLHSWGRTSVGQGSSRFVDIHLLQAEARQQEEFALNI